MATEFKGAITALITPFDKQQEVDFEALEALVDRQLEGGIDGLVVCGTTGESATMTQSEQLAVIECVASRVARRVPVLAGTGSNDTRRSVAMTQAASQIEGVDAALVVCPYYNKPNEAMLIAHFTRVAEEGGLPVMLYNVPGRTVVSLTPAAIGELARHGDIIGVKEATGDLNFGTQVIEQVEQPFALLSGDDFTTMPFVAMGGHGCISVVSNLLPGVMSELVAASASGDLARARALHLQIQPLARMLFARPNPVPTKEIAAMLGWCQATVRAPLMNSEEAFLKKLRETARRYDALAAQL